MNIKALDLNLLKVFDALYRERHVTRAGRAIGLAQPSVSNALGRLRDVTGDQLFLRTPAGMVPTDKAHAIAPQVQQALALIVAAMVPEPAFDPDTARAEITLAAADVVVLQLGVAIARHFSAAAPGFDFRFRPMDKDTVFGALDRGALDGAIGVFADPPARFHHRLLYRDSLVCVARRGHPALAAGLSVQRFAQLPHVLMTLRGDAQGAVDDRLRALGLQRRVALTVGQFTVIPDIIAQTDYLAAMPASIADALAARAGCAVYPMPFDRDIAWTVSMLWAHTTPASRFAIAGIERVAQRLNSP